MKKFLKYLITILILGGLASYGLSAFVVQRSQDRIVCDWDESGFTLRDNAPAEFFTNRDMADPGTLDLPDAILVLGAGLSADGSPSPMLRDRLDLGIYLYKEGYAPKILLSGDNGQEEYNEIKPMLDYTLEQGVPREDVFLDYAGFSTYESMYRARDVFEVRSVIVVTQTYHLYRALFIGKSLGLDVYGAAADQQQYWGQAHRQIREILARDKDVFSCLLHRKPTYLGEPIPITGTGNATEE